jgi:hypothetical protein
VRNLEIIGAVLGKFSTGGFIREDLSKTLPNGEKAYLSRMVGVHEGLGYNNEM